MKPIAFVIPWFGRDLKGGAEQQAWQVTTRLAARGYKIEILTTCGRSFLDDWASNYYELGIDNEEGVVIRRFSADARNHIAFDSLNSRMLSISRHDLKSGVSPVTSEESNIFVKENVNSAALLNYLKSHKKNYHAFIFIPYLYGPSINGLPLVCEKAFLQPCLHDEVYAYLPEVENIFHKTKGILFNSKGEARLASRLYGPGLIGKSWIVGEGVEIDENYSGEVETIGVLNIKNVPFVLFLGRRDATKNTDMLVRSYLLFKNLYPDSNLQLVLAGPGEASFSGYADGIVDLGLIEENEKGALLSNCRALFQPSTNESYSRVIMEAWFKAKPVAVHRECLATKTAVQDADGGWLAGDEAEWTEMFSFVENLENKKLLEYGERGRSYARQYAVWDRVIDRYEKVLLSLENHKKRTHRAKKLKKIYQLLPDLTYGDAVSNYAISARNHLRDVGYESDIVVLRAYDERVSREARLFEPNLISKDTGILYHHSIGSDLTPFVINHPGSKCLIYHNITPAKFYKPYRPDFAILLEQGRSELRKLAPIFPISAGDSFYNASELERWGFNNPRVLPIAVSPDKWDNAPDSGIMGRFQDGKANLLFVGRVAPNKCIEHLINGFSHYLDMDPDARLIIVGEIVPDDPYAMVLGEIIEKYGLMNHVLFSGKVSDFELQAYMRSAHLFWSMSEHEGFCIPLIEAMWFDVPVLAYKSSAVPETLGDASIMFNTKEDVTSVAALAKLLVRDEELREKVLRAQRKRRIDFLPEKVLPKLDALIAMMEG